LTVMNVIWWYMRSKHEALCARSMAWCFMVE
jgi:hypothetical protein